MLIVHLLLGYRRLQDIRYYQDDHMVRRLLGLERLPDVATVSRTLAGLDDTSVIHLRRLSWQRALDQLGGLGLARITLDFDGSVLSTGRFAELKSQTQMDYVPTRRKNGNQVYLLSAVLAHNLNREMRMLCYEQERSTAEKRAPLWRFEQLGTLRRKLIQRAGRLTKPQGNLALTMSANLAVKSELLHYLDVLKHAV